MALPCLRAGAYLSAEGFGEVTGVGEACGGGDDFEVPAGGAEERLGAVDAALEQVLVRGGAHALAEGPGEVEEAQAGDFGEVFEADLRLQVGGDVLEGAVEAWFCNASLVGGRDGVAVFADEGYGEGEAEEVAVEGAGGGA